MISKHIDSASICATKYPKGMKVPQKFVRLSGMGERRAIRAGFETLQVQHRAHDADDWCTATGFTAPLDLIGASAGMTGQQKSPGPGQARPGGVSARYPSEFSKSAGGLESLAANHRTVSNAHHAAHCGSPITPRPEQQGNLSATPYWLREATSRLSATLRSNSPMRQLMATI